MIGDGNTNRLMKIMRIEPYAHLKSNDAIVHAPEGVGRFVHHWGYEAQCAKFCIVKDSEYGIT